MGSNSIYPGSKTLPGIVKIVYGREHHEILGVHMIGSYASEIIYGAAAMVAKEQRVSDVQKIVFPHPLSESVTSSASIPAFFALSTVSPTVPTSGFV